MWNSEAIWFWCINIDEILRDDLKPREWSGLCYFNAQYVFVDWNDKNSIRIYRKTIKIYWQTQIDVIIYHQQEEIYNHLSVGMEEQDVKDTK